MSSKLEKSVKVSLVFIVIGIILITVSVSLGARFENRISFGEKSNINETYSNVSSIKIKINASKVNVKIGNTFKIEANDIYTNNFSSKVESGIWTITEAPVNFMNFGSNNSVINIYLPKNFESTKLQIDIGAGEVIIDEVKADQSIFNVGAGNLEINNLTTNDLKLDCGVGNSTISGIVLNDVDVNCGIGNVELDLIGNELDYNYDLKVGIGEILLNNNEISGLGNKYINNGSLNKTFKVDCGIGKVTLKIRGGEHFGS